MLVLTRRIGEAINIGDDIKIIVFKANGQYVDIGAIAPKDVPVHREEIYKKIQNNILTEEINHGS